MTFFGCNKGKLQQLEAENQALREERGLQDSLLNDFVSTFNLFEDNLAQIKEKENLISMEAGSEEFREGGREQILDDLQLIDELLAQNRQIIADLSAKADQSSAQSSQLRRTVNTLKQKLADRDQEILGLKEQLATLNFTVEELNTTVDSLAQYAERLTEVTETQTARLQAQTETMDEQARTIETQRDALNQAYFVVGSNRELKDANILVRSKRLNSEFDAKSFTTIDMREISSIPLTAKKAELLTPHPSDSYVLQDENNDNQPDAIEIIDPARFWKASRYLVVVTD
ncbi:MAG: hypothetical protein D6722_29375 [Bacteroidetes bacterium]|nr:MAG: hypothetical protein D6722_29375 [Bacteroidota bacterium]